MRHLLLEPSCGLLPQSSRYHHWISRQVNYLEVILDSSYFLTTHMQTISQSYHFGLFSKFIHNLITSDYLNPKHDHLLAWSIVIRPDWSPSSHFCNMLAHLPHSSHSNLLKRQIRLCHSLAQNLPVSFLSHEYKI